MQVSSGIATASELFYGAPKTKAQPPNPLHNPNIFIKALQSPNLFHNPNTSTQKFQNPLSLLTTTLTTVDDINPEGPKLWELRYIPYYG